MRTTINSCIDVLKSDPRDAWATAIWELIIPMGDFIDEQGLFVGHCADCGHIVYSREQWAGDRCAQCAGD